MLLLIKIKNRTRNDENHLTTAFSATVHEVQIHVPEATFAETPVRPKQAHTARLAALQSQHRPGSHLVQPAVRLRCCCDPSASLVARPLGPPDCIQGEVVGTDASGRTTLERKRRVVYAAKTITTSDRGAPVRDSEEKSDICGQSQPEGSSGNRDPASLAPAPESHRQEALSATVTFSQNPCCCAFLPTAQA